MQTHRDSAAPWVASTAAPQPAHFDATTPLIIVLNHRSGDAEGEQHMRVLRDTFTAAGRAHVLLPADDAVALRNAARRAVQLARQRHGAVIAVGGDGTLNAVAQAVLDDPQAATHPLPFGALPQGTFNLFGRNFGLPLALADSAGALLTARVMPIQVGRVIGGAGAQMRNPGSQRNPEAPAAEARAGLPQRSAIFLVNASVGLYPVLLEDREAWKQRFGRSRLVAMLAGFATALRVTRHRVLTLQLQRAQSAAAASGHSDNAGADTVQATTLFIGNNALQLESIGIAAQALARGALVAVTLAPVGIWRLFGLALRGAMGQLGEATDVTSFPVQSLTVTPVGRRWRPLPSWRGHVKVAVDGEVVRMQPPLAFSAMPGALHLLLPAAVASGQQNVPGLPESSP